MDETDTTRFIFRPELVDNQANPEACIAGKFIRQRKLADKRWEDTESFTSASLKAGQEVNLPIRSEQLARFIRGVEEFRAIHGSHGIPLGHQQFTVTDGNVAELINQLSGLGNPEELAQLIKGIDPKQLGNLASTVSIARIEQAIDEISVGIQEDHDEEWWQQKLLEWPWVLSQLFPQPIVLAGSKAYVGGKGIDNSGSMLVDFMVKNELTNNIALIEIKTPNATLLRSEYRTGIFPPSVETTGATEQILTYKQSLQQDYSVIQGNSATQFSAFNPRCVVIVGNSKELDTTDKQRSFELYRGALKDVEIVTFDELLSRCRGLISLIKSA